MGDVKSQFVLGGYTQNNYLLDSLTVLSQDTRGGLNADTATRLAAMSGYVSANPDKTNSQAFNAYVGKLVTASGSAPEAKPSVASRKPGNGLM
jgi:hypothetical protein